jgi:1,4-alpha-glucan branching enzyme
VNRITQDHITDQTPDGTNLVLDSQGEPLGVTVNVWGPNASAVYLNGTFAGVDAFSRDQDPSLLLQKRGEHWTGFLAGAAPGDPYQFFVVGDDGGGFKRDPYARELTLDPPFPQSHCVIRDPRSFQWHDQGFRPPPFNEMIVYQLHIGTWSRRSGNRLSTYLDVVEKTEYLAELGANVVQPLPVTEFEATPGLGYDNCDYYSPEMGYQISDETNLTNYLATINRLLAQKERGPLQMAAIRGGDAQLKVMVDLLHLYGMAVVFDVVYNHGGGFGGFGGIPEDREAIFFWDRQKSGDNNRSLFFTDQTYSGGLGFALFKQPVSDFLVHNAVYLFSEFHIDGLRYDEISQLLNLNAATGADFCRRITAACRASRPDAIHNAEFWPSESNLVSAYNVVDAGANGGLDFDVRQADGLRAAVRAAVGAAANGRDAEVNMDAIAFHIQTAADFRDKWRAVQCVENHDLVYKGRDLRVARLADQSNARSWFARSRSRVATGLILTAPGIPQLFMGQVFLEDKPWSDNPDDGLNIFFDGLGAEDPSMRNHLRFTRELVTMRRRLPGLNGEGVNAFLHHNVDRIIAFQRWVDGIGQDVVVVASLNESTFHGYVVGFPDSGRWGEVFNSDVYDNWVNPVVAGNGGQIWADGPGAQGLPFSAAIVIPANGLLVFTRVN